jgi:hypothetical protein
MCSWTPNSTANIFIEGKNPNISEDIAFSWYDKSRFTEEKKIVRHRIGIAHDVGQGIHFLYLSMPGILISNSILYSSYCLSYGQIHFSKSCDGLNSQFNTCSAIIWYQISSFLLKAILSEYRLWLPDSTQFSRTYDIHNIQHTKGAEDRIIVASCV